MDSFGLVAKTVLKVGVFGYHVWKPFSSCRYFSFGHFIFFSWVGMANTKGPYNTTKGSNFLESFGIVA